MQHLNGEAHTRAQRVCVDYVPGTRFLYSNAGFSILQLAVEDLTGQTFAEYMWTTTSDCARFIVELQRSLRGLSNRILEAEFVDAMLSPHAASEYGLGVFLQEREGEVYFRHIGDAAGFIAGFAAHRTDGYGAVVFVNSLGGIQLVREILQAIGKVYQWRGVLPPEIRPPELPAGFQDALVGRYQAGPDAVLTVWWEQNHLMMRPTDAAPTRIYAATPETFVCRERLGALVFRRDDTGLASTAFVGFADA